MKTKDQTLLEEAYKKVASNSWFTDKNGEPITHGDEVRYLSNDQVYKVVGGNIAKNQLQLEVIEDLAPGQSPRWIHVKPTQLIKVSK
jgi:hypothetical protein